MTAIMQVRLPSSDIHMERDLFIPMGKYLTEQTATAFLNVLGFAEPFQEIFELPQQCEIACRQKDRKRYFFILNYDKHSAEILVKTKLKDVLANENVTGEMTIPGYGVMILEQEAEQYMNRKKIISRAVILADGALSDTGSERKSLKTQTLKEASFVR